MAGNLAIAVTSIVSQSGVWRQGEKPGDAIRTRRVESRLPPRKNFIDGVWRVAQQQHVATCRPGCFRSGEDVAGDAGPLH